MIRGLVAPGVATAEAFDDPPEATLYPEESSVMGRSMDKRRREFTTARLCARNALTDLGVLPAPIVPGEHGAPCWPPGVVGSMTHCAGYRAAAVARARVFCTIGIDAEPHDVLPAGVLEAIARPEEQRRLAMLGDGVCWDRLLFSAKESVYKAWFPLTRRWLGFQEADVTINANDGTFRARLLVPGPVLAGEQLGEFAGRWLARDGLVLTAISVPHPGTATAGGANRNRPRK